ncbi:hypothetical protein D9613_011741 [Agrocybe pediades]|uniref:DUF6534 domain-containing protein n=1 Tax=Agrocybe pediades TaxID=84607 RepID=A0A8H4QKW4_9AGAR|nr:hypothetical protein D9613_011741 [Agrocybe pediades]
MSAASPLPPNFVFPKFDATLGALYVGSGAATILYGVSCLQLFIYATGPRSSRDKLWLRLFVWLTFIFVNLKHPYDSAMSTAEQAVMMAGMYRFLVTDFLNPLALPSGGPGSAEVFIYVESLLLCFDSMVPKLYLQSKEFCLLMGSTQVFLLADMGHYCFKLFKKVSNRFHSAHAMLVGATSLEILNRALISATITTDLAINGFNHKILTGNTPDFILAFKLATSGQIAYDVIVTAAMTWSLQRARMGIKRKDHVIRIITLFTINTNLLTTLLAIAGLVTFLTLPHATVYGGIGFLLGKTYFNSFLAVLNARDYLREKFDSAGNTHVAYPEFSDGAVEGDTEDTMSAPYALTSLSDMRFAPAKVDTHRVA